MLLNFVSYTLHGIEQIKSFLDPKDQKSWISELILKHRDRKDLTIDVVVESGVLKVCRGFDIEEGYAEDGQITSAKNYQLHSM